MQRSTRAASQLVSGQRLLSAGDNTGEFATGSSLRVDLRAFQQAGRNTNDAISLARTAEGGIDQISQHMTRMRELAVQSASDGVTDKERAHLQEEFGELRFEIDRIAGTTEFNGQKVLNASGGNGSGKFTFQVDINSSGANQTTLQLNDHSALSLFGGNVPKIDSLVNAQAAIQGMDFAFDKLTEGRTLVGSAINRLENALSHSAGVVESLSAGASHIMDTDLASTSAEYRVSEAIRNSGISMLAQANQNPMLALRLLG